MTRQNAVKILKSMLLYSALLALLFLMFKTANLIGQIYPAYSLRYYSGISSGASNKAIRHINEQAEEYDLAFWKEKTSSIKSNLETIDVKCVFYSGKSQLVWPAKFIAGGYPGDFDAGGCAISSALAWRLWGSLDVLDMDVKIDSRDYKVRGVFEDKQEMAIAGTSGDTVENWNTVELATAYGKSSLGEIKQLAEQSGLGTPDSVVNGPALTAAAKMVSYILPLILATFAMFSFLRLIIRKNHLYREIMILGICLAVALFLPEILDMIPQRFIPGRWSDFDYWALLRTDVMAEVKSYFLMVPLEIDALAKFNILKQLILLFAGFALTVMLIYHQKNSIANNLKNDSFALHAKQEEQPQKEYKILDAP